MRLKKYIILIKEAQKSRNKESKRSTQVLLEIRKTRIVLSSRPPYWELNRLSLNEAPSYTPTCITY